MSSFTRKATVWTPSSRATSRKMGCPDTAGTPEMTCAFMPDIPSQENLESGRGGSSAKFVCGVPVGKGVTTGSVHDDGASDRSNSIRVNQKETATIAAQAKRKSLFGDTSTPRLTILLTNLRWKKNHSIHCRSRIRGGAFEAWQNVERYYGIPGTTQSRLPSLSRPIRTTAEIAKHLGRRIVRGRSGTCGWLPDSG